MACHQWEPLASGAEQVQAQVTCFPPSPPTSLPHPWRGCQLSVKGQKGFLSCGSAPSLHANGVGILPSILGFSHSFYSSFGAIASEVLLQTQRFRESLQTTLSLPVEPRESAFPAPSSLMSERSGVGLSGAQPGSPRIRHTLKHLSAA